MLYFKDPFYKISGEEYVRLFKVVSEAILGSCYSYEGLISPYRNKFIDINPPQTVLHGVFPENPEERKKSLENFINQCFDSRKASLQDYHLRDFNGREIVCIHDCITNHSFELTGDEFNKASEALVKNGFESDILCSHEKMINFSFPSRGILGFFGFTSYRSFSPRQWEAMDEEKKKKILEDWDRIE